ncbi:MAG: methyltransferase family protein [Gemmatimonadota bacterium]
MTLNDHFERSGAWLFRWRSYLPLLLFGIVLLGMRDFAYPAETHLAPAGWALFCLSVGVLGLIVRAIAVGYAALGTSGRVTCRQEADALNTTGMYSIVRHPLYLGNYLMWLSASLLTRTIWVPLVISLIFWIYYERIMTAEEAFLRMKFGDLFERWAAATPAFLPSFRLWIRPSTTFEPRRVLRRERSSVLGLAVTFAAYDFLVGSAARGTLHMDILWIVLTAIGLLYYVAMHFEKRIARNSSPSAARSARQVAS